MATKKSKSTEWPKIIRGSHSTRTEYENGRVEFETHWEELKRDVGAALIEYAIQQRAEKKTDTKKTVSVKRAVPAKKTVTKSKK
jgi:hypothetical protein